MSGYRPEELLISVIARLLAGTRLLPGAQLTLQLAEGSGVFAGESVTRRLDRLAEVMGLAATTTLAA